MWSGMQFFPTGAFDDQPCRHALRESWSVSHLLAMEELPLYPRVVGQLSVYRLLFLPTFEQPSVIRLAEAGRVWRVTCKRSDGQGGYSPGKLAARVERELSRAEAKRFVRLLNRVAFWSMPTFESYCAPDGSRAVLEGTRIGEYHVVDRWSPRSTAYAELIEFLMNLCPGVGQHLTKPPKYLPSFAGLGERLRLAAAEGGPAEPDAAS